MGKDIEEGKNTTQFNCVHFSENSSFLQWCFFAISLFYVNGIYCDISAFCVRKKKRNKIPTKEQAHRTLWFICVIGKQNDKLFEHDGWFNSFFLSIFFSTLVVSLFFLAAILIAQYLNMKSVACIAGPLDPYFIRFCVL